MDDFNDPFAPAKSYYKTDYRRPSLFTGRAVKDASESLVANLMGRRGSLDVRGTNGHKVLIKLDEVQDVILRQEDTDKNYQITIEDTGPKLIRVPTLSSGGHRFMDIRGNYMLSNLLQEVALAKREGRKEAVIDLDRLSENPVDRLQRMIRTVFWDDLIRSMDIDGLERICNDPKNLSSTGEAIIYTPYYDDDAYEYYIWAAKVRPDLNLKVVKLPQDITPEYVKSINDKFGILALAAEIGPKGTGVAGGDSRSYKPIPFVVPGGRFNEMYGWDSYFEALGLLTDYRIELAAGMVSHFVYQIKHYGKIMNANRSYYLTRSQPPFLTDMALQVYNKLPKTAENEEWLKVAINAAIDEYYKVWMTPPRLDEETGLNRYYSTGIGMPPECEPTHFDHTIKPYAEKLGISLNEYKCKYQSGEIKEPELDEYFVHDRAVRESGHDTTYRFESCCAYLVTVDLNSLLCKYETDIAKVIHEMFEGKLVNNKGEVETNAIWEERALKRKQNIDKYLWDEERGMYFDYNIKTKKRTVFESATTIWPMWAGCASAEQAEKLVPNALKALQVAGGLVSTSKRSTQEASSGGPGRQWDYPYGWAPHQMLAWVGLKKYGYIDHARNMAYRWLFTITQAYTDYNGVVPEKFDIANLTHRVEVEYGNVGTDFKLLSTCGFGWMNASYDIGLEYLTPHMRRALSALTHPDELFSKLNSRR
ncbi:Neutral trehalase [Zancudomyces culisetae]|uniref:Trehalase n=1 Tax=Zancudomyces culisetae TaxID=1213189 RepID=A0A1R1PZC9_ZANCU|nr:Neutral trehalase [Zancudomyces culisetae]|eukprot:OMH86322.1 Neutral trehalase [Zancudomyces culisetae]